MHEMRVMAVGVEPGAYRPVLLLEEASGDHRLLPVWIGPAETVGTLAGAVAAMRAR